MEMESILLILAFLILLLVHDWRKRKALVEGMHRKAVFITGCDSGFGNALAKSLYTKGVPVYAACLTEEGAKSLEEETGDGLKTVIVDVTNTESVRRAAEFVRDNLPNNVVLWGVVNNAGIAGHSGPVEFLTKEDFKQVMEVNVYGMIDVTIAFLPMLKQTKGRIVNLTSILANIAYPILTPYCVSKYAASGFSDSLRVEKSAWGISVSTVKPACYRTSMLDMKAYGEAVRTKWVTLSEDLHAEYGEDYSERSIKLTKRMVNILVASDISPVIDALEHALFSVCPRHVYYPGILAKLIKISPYFIVDKVVQYYLDLPRCLRKE